MYIFGIQSQLVMTARYFLQSSPQNLYLRGYTASMFLKISRVLHVASESFAARLEIGSEKPMGGKVTRKQHVSPHF
jgi:hypothetical protein